MIDPLAPPASSSPEPRPHRAAVPVGLGGGVVAGLLGVGGGVVMVPALTIVLRRPQHVAHATSLVAVALGATAAAARFAFDGAVDPVAAVAIVAGSWTGARLGADLAPKVSETRLRTAFAVMLAIVAIRFLVPSGAAEAAAGATVGLDPLAIGVLVASGLVAGITSSLLGVGGGVVLVPAMVLLLGFDQHLAEGTSLAAIVPTALRGARRHARNGYTDWPLGLRLGAGAVVGALLGSTVALQLDAAALSRTFGILLLVLATLTLLRRATRSTPSSDSTDLRGSDD